MESEWAMFKTLIMEAAGKSSCQKVTDTCWGGNLSTRECTLVVKEPVKVKKKAFRAWLARGYPKAADKYWEARRSAALVVTEAKIWVWKEFGEAIQKDFWLASKKFRQTAGAQEGKAENGPGCVQPGRRTAELD